MADLSTSHCAVSLRAPSPGFPTTTAIPGHPDSPKSSSSGNNNGHITEDEVTRLVSEHLVQPSSDSETDERLGSVAHGLLGGDTTYNVYQWKERRDAPPRRNSFHDLPGAGSTSNGGVVQRSLTFDLRASDLREPGAFRRHFVLTRQASTGRGGAQGGGGAQQGGTIFTRNFIDFLLLYGFYGGDVVPSDEEEEDIVDEAEARRILSSDDGAGDEDDPLLTPRPSALPRPPSIATVHGTSAKKAFFMLIKAFVGTGVLFLPKAFANGGMLFSIVLMVFLGWLTLHCMLLLVETSRELGGSFGDIGEYFYGPRMRQLVLASIAISQMGFSCAYYIFVAQNLRDLTMIVTNCHLILPDYFFIILQFLVYGPLSWVRKIKHFSWTSLVADVFILLGLGYIFYYDFSILATRGPSPDVELVNFKSFSLFVGTAMFAFEGICLILPIAESMKRPERFDRVLSLCVLTIGVVFISTGVIGYLTFGKKSSTIVFLDLPDGSPPVMVLQFFYAVAIMLSFPLTVYPSIRITESALFGVRDGKVDAVVKWQKNAFRLVLVGLLGAVAWFGADNLDKFVALVGCFACIPLSFIYPAMFHYRLSNDWRVKTKDMVIAVLGVVAMLYTTWVTVEEWVVGAPDVPRNRCESRGGMW
ncbi:transmembrane amino acid transporter protein-domain-containing protein [Cladochytrium replicatum]|nr:transmembrane amino acid transporter protein-domain-containing protein [Cladochytrium replicatum]